MRRTLVALLASLLAGVALLHTAAADPAENAGTFTDPILHFSIEWDPEAFSLATVATGGILLAQDAMVLFIGPDLHRTAKACVDHRVQIDMIDAPLLYAVKGKLEVTPEVDGLTEEYASLYAWPDGIRHYAWIGCVPLTGGGNIVLRLLARTQDWTVAVATYDPVLATITLPDDLATPDASPTTM
jgi:hypothetical protein